MAQEKDSSTTQVVQEKATCLIRESLVWELALVAHQTHPPIHHSTWQGVPSAITWSELHPQNASRYSILNEKLHLTASLAWLCLEDHIANYQFQLAFADGNDW